MSNKATRDLLEKLHGLQANSFIQRLEQDIKDNIPTDAATLSAISKFLKDNDVVADPATNTELGMLQDKFKEQRAARAKRALELVHNANTELKQAAG